MSDLADVIPPQTAGPDGLIQCDFGTVLGMRGWLAKKPASTAEEHQSLSDGRAFAVRCGAALHLHIKTGGSKEHWQECGRDSALYAAARLPFMACSLVRCLDPSLPITIHLRGLVLS